MINASDVNIFKPFHPPIKDIKAIVSWMDDRGVTMAARDVVSLWLDFSEDYDAYWLTPSGSWLRRFVRFYRKAQG